MIHPEHSKRAGGLILVALSALAGCRDSPPQPIETIDVDPGIVIDTSEDPQARERQAGLVGILPGDFPSDLPLYIPASLIDFGETDSGRLTVSLLSPHSVSRVRRGLYAQLREKGWATAAGNGDLVALSKGRKRAWLHLADGRPGTLYRIEYLPSR